MKKKKKRTIMDMKNYIITHYISALHIIKNYIQINFMTIL